MTSIERVAVIGAGTMGHGIAQVCVMAGLHVHLYDPQPGQVESAVGRVLRANLERGIERGSFRRASQHGAGEPASVEALHESA